ncbi:MAG: hypothetical protein ACO321_08220 [Ilumatobacteraceae bacterium]
MKLTEREALARFSAHDHGTLSTFHPTRGIDSVPAVYAFDGQFVGIPVDRIKPKSSTRLRRQDNVALDPRATLLVDQWDSSDWSRLWWVRVHLEPVSTPDNTQVRELSRLLAQRYVQYRDEPFETVMVFRILAVYGWSASGTDYKALEG